MPFGPFSQAYLRSEYTKYIEGFLTVPPDDRMIFCPRHPGEAPVCELLLPRGTQKLVLHGSIRELLHIPGTRDIPAVWPDI